ncbi:hypothetical protein KZX45_12420 [Georgenia sp. EYE_87]|uniref:hypothetical protein n=1 Tax=Georgenia sp. EYE_87 TaxID=2853448 RepID=UPI0020066569|nr:hypothetical protein [Georgenia sp. EYE_87]MCK6211347.1 hypothetical protein [Georgenia sp. EYE_87]
MRHAINPTTYWTLAAGAGLVLAATGPDLALANHLPTPTAALAGLMPLPVFLVVAAALAAVLAATAARFTSEANASDAGAPRRRDGAARPVMVGAVAGAALALLTLTAGLLALVGYLPLALVMAPFHEGMRDSLVRTFDASLVVQLIVVAGVLLWGAAAREHLRRHPVPVPAWARPDAAARWGRWAVAVAVVPPLTYALTRFVWLVYPLGFDPEFWEVARSEGSLLAGVWLGAFAVLGAILTIGLVQRWGEIVPSWVPGIGGRRVPPAAAVVPATFVSIIVTPAGISMFRQAMADDMATEIIENWAAAGPTFLWPLWGLALGAATLAYALRRAGERRASVDAEVRIPVL